MSTTCINLREHFGDRFRVRHEESYHAQRGPRAWADDPWLQIIPCDFGHICPWGGTRLAACTNGRGPTATKLTGLPCVKVVQNGTDGVNVTFDVADFEQVAAVMRPKRVRRLSPEARKAAGERLAKYQFRPAVEPARDERPCEFTGRAVSLDVPGDSHQDEAIPRR
jgi:hypothetical protein